MDDDECYERHESPRPTLKTRATPSLSQARANAAQNPSKSRRRMQDKRPPRTKRYPCTSCKKLFDRPCSLQQHIRTHTGEKPHKCPTCGRGFATKSNVYRHSRRCELKSSIHHLPQKQFAQSSELLDAHELAGAIPRGSGPQPGKRARGIRCSVSESDSDEFTEDSSEREDQEEMPAQTPSTSRASGRTIQMHASSSTISPTSFSSVSITPNHEKALYPIPHSLDFFVSQTYHPEPPNSSLLARRTTLDNFVYDNGNPPRYLSNSTGPNWPVATLPGQENVWNGVGLYLPSSEPSSSPLVPMAWGARPDSMPAYNGSPLQETLFVRYGAAVPGPVISSGFSTATVEQNPTYGAMPTPSMSPRPQQLFGSHTRGNDNMPLDSSWANSTFQFQAELGQELFAPPKQALSLRKESVHIGLVDEGSINPNRRDSLLGVVSPTPAPSPASSAGSNCSAGSGSIAPSMLPLSPPATRPSSFTPSTVTGQTHKRGRAHARTISLPTGGVPAGSVRMRRNALYTLSVSPPPRSSVSLLSPVPTLYDPLGHGPDPCLQPRPSSVASAESICSSISPAPSVVEPFGQPGMTSSTHPLLNGPSADPYYPRELQSDWASPSASRTNTPLYDPPPGPPPPSGQWPSGFDASQCPPYRTQ